MRKVVYSLLMADEAFTALVPRVYERGAVPDTPQSPFAVIAFGGQQRGPGRNVRVDIWVHDNRGSYLLIDSALKEIRRILTSVVHYELDGERLAQADWMDDSNDLYDDTYRTNTRTAGFQLVGTGL